MIRERLTDPRWVVWLEDPSLAAAVAAGSITQEQLRAYAQSRSIDDLGGLEAVKKWIDPPSLFLLAPMTTQQQQFEGRYDVLFALCVRDMENVPAGAKSFPKAANGSIYLADESLAMIPRGCVLELGELAESMATREGVTLPFSPPDGWELRLSTSIARAVIAARIETAKRGQGSDS